MFKKAPLFDRDRGIEIEKLYIGPTVSVQGGKGERKPQIRKGKKMPKLIILRGNSGSGKTTIAKELQNSFGRNTMLISQDVIRRDMLKVKDGENTEALPLMKELLIWTTRIGNMFSSTLRTTSSTVLSLSIMISGSKGRFSSM